MIVLFDIGGTAIKGGFFNDSGDGLTDPKSIVTLPRIATPGDDFTAFVAALKGVIDQCAGVTEKVSISLAGIVNAQTGITKIANIPCINGRALQNELQAVLNVPVVINNDADCFALAEARLGAGRGHHTVFGVILGTGVGGGIVIDGHILQSGTGYVGEWGHGPVAARMAGTPPVQIPHFACGCGLNGCLDATCSARGLEKLHLFLHEVALPAEEIAALWLSDDKRAAHTIDLYVDIIAAPLALVVNTLGATIVPVGGGLSNVPQLIAAIDEAVRAKTLFRSTQPLLLPAKIQALKTGVEPGLIGAAFAGLSDLHPLGIGCFSR